MTLNRKNTNLRAMGLEHMRIANDMRDCEIEELRLRAPHAWDDAALTVMTACLRNLQLSDFARFTFRFSTENPLFIPRLPFALAGKLKRRMQARRKHADSSAL